MLDIGSAQNKAREDEHNTQHMRDKHRRNQQNATCKWHRKWGKDWMITTTHTRAHTHIKERRRQLSIWVVLNRRGTSPQGASIFQGGVNIPRGHEPLRALQHGKFYQ